MTLKRTNIYKPPVLGSTSFLIDSDVSKIEWSVMPSQNITKTLSSIDGFQQLGLDYVGLYRFFFGGWAVKNNRGECFTLPHLKKTKPDI